MQALAIKEEVGRLVTEIGLAYVFFFFFYGYVAPLASADFKCEVHCGPFELQKVGDSFREVYRLVPC